MPNEFAIDITKIRDQARQHLKQGWSRNSTRWTSARVITVLNEVCYLRYTQNAVVAQGIDREQLASMFRDHAAGELGHFRRVSERINQLGGSPDINPATLMQRSHTDYVTPGDTDLQAMLRENLVAERIAIGTYAEVIRRLGDSDVTSRRMMEDILQEEEEHADELNVLFVG
jgi:bacterioferritin